MSISPDFPEAGSEFGWRRGPLYGVLRLRPPVPEVSPEGRELLRRHARDARVAVEIGVAEGGSARYPGADRLPVRRWRQLIRGGVSRLGDWSPHMRVGGVVVLQGARLTEGRMGDR